MARRVHRAHAAGLYDKDAPYWRGERAETIVRRRVKGYTKKKKRKTPSSRRKS